LVDCLPTDFPPPKRLPAWASRPDKLNTATKTKDQIFMFAPKEFSMWDRPLYAQASTLDSNM
jgi:hypothetical protein